MNSIIAIHEFRAAVIYFVVPTICREFPKKRDQDFDTFIWWMLYYQIEDHHRDDGMYQRHHLPVSWM
jgi:hypothetical protein